MSIFLPPPVGRNDTLEEERVRFKNLRGSAHDLLAKYWMPDSAVDEFLRPLDSVLSELLQLNPRRHSLAIFFCGQSLDVFRVAHELNEQLTIARVFY